MILTNCKVGNILVAEKYSDHARLLSFAHQKTAKFMACIKNVEGNMIWGRIKRISFAVSAGNPQHNISIPQTS